MKTIDFSHAGGFPLTQDRLDFLQSAYKECLNALACMGVNSLTPIIISGMEQTIPGFGEVSVADGWFFYNGELIKFYGSTQSIGIGGTVAVVEIASTATNLTYNDGSVYPALNEKTATLISALPLSDANHFPYSDMKPFQLVFGETGREATWNTLSVSTDPSEGGVTGTISYKKNLLTNTLQIQGTLTSGNAQNFTASPYAIAYSMGTLPTGYIPANQVYFSAQYYLASLIKDDLGVAWIKEVNATLTNTGELMINWIKPDVAVSGYGILFNVILPLD